MLDLLKQIFAEPESAPSISPERQLQLTSAALLVEIAVSDNRFDQRELALIESLLQQNFALSAAESSQLIEEAKQEQDHATSIHQFTSYINQHCDGIKKRELVSQLWQIAYADGEIDKYEEYMIRRMADLMHLRHSDYIKAKKLAQAQLPTG